MSITEAFVDEIFWNLASIKIPRRFPHHRNLKVEPLKWLLYGHFKMQIFRFVGSFGNRFFRYFSLFPLFFFLKALRKAYRTVYTTCIYYLMWPSYKFINHFHIFLWFWLTNKSFQTISSTVHIYVACVMTYWSFVENGLYLLLHNSI